jgi:3-oxoadipate enol-lactonase
MKVRANGIDIRCEIEGDGPLVVLSHALACDLSMWDEQAAALRSSYRVLRYDSRGHGSTTAPEGAYTLEQLAEDAHALLSNLGLSQVHWVGLSMGGIVGQFFALSHCAMLGSLTLCDTTSRSSAAAASTLWDRIRTARESGMEALVEATLQRWFTPAFRLGHQHVMDRVATMIRSTPVLGYVGCCQALTRFDVTDRLAALAVPALILVGDQDSNAPPDTARAMAAALPDARLTILESASHLSNLEQPAEFNRVLLEFLGRVSGRSGPTA